MDLVLPLAGASEAPLHRRVYEDIRAAILNGRLRPGDRLPATRALARQLSLSRTTVTEAYDQLQAEGYLHGRQGSGTYVASSLPEEAVQSPAKVSGGRSGSNESPLVLSRWGARVAGDGYRSLLRSAEPVTFQYDFRPHRVAQDSFPWHAWRGAVERALSRSQANLLSYPPSAGHPELREAIAAHVAKYRGVICSPEQVVVVNGSQQGLNLLAHLLVEPRERAAVEDPGYPAARMILESRGLQLTRVPVDREGMIVEQLASAKPQRIIHVTPSHQDPTGATLSLSRRLALLELAERNRSVIVEDDYDSEFRYEGRPVESLQGLDRNGLVVYAGTFSKSVLAGLRVGFLILPEPLVGPFVIAKSLWDSGTSMLEQAALHEFMISGDFERHIRRVRRLYKSRRDALVAALYASFGDGVEVGERHGGLNVLVACDIDLTEQDFAERAEQAGIGLRAASAYYSQPPSKPTFLMGFAALSEDAIRTGIECLFSLVKGARQPPPSSS